MKKNSPKNDKGATMENTYSKIQELLHQKADCQARLNLLPYDGTPEIKDRDGLKYLYIRKRVGSRLTWCGKRQLVCTSCRRSTRRGCFQ